jgi:hypothetical protein
MLLNKKVTFTLYLRNEKAIKEQFKICNCLTGILL